MRIRRALLEVLVLVSSQYIGKANDIKTIQMTKVDADTCKNLAYKYVNDH